MMAARRRKREGPRQAIRWIGDAFALEGDYVVGVQAVWRGTKEPRCARVRVTEMSRDWEFGVDDAPTQLAASAARGQNLVPRFATYREEDDVVIVEEDVADLTLRDVVAAVASKDDGDDDDGSVGGARAPTGLGLYVAREMMRALEQAGDVRLELNPKNVDIAWDGRVLLRPIIRLEDRRDAIWDEDAVDFLSYLAPGDEHVHHQQRVVGFVLYELLTGRHPFHGVDEHDGEDLPDEDEYAGRLLQRMDADVREPIDGLPLPVNDALDKLLSSSFATFTEAARGLDDVLRAIDPFEASDLAGMLRGFFAARRRACDVERDDRLTVMPGPKVEPETWGVLDDSVNEEDLWDTTDVKDVHRGPTWELDAPNEPSVDPIDPFEDE